MFRRFLPAAVGPTSGVANRIGAPPHLARFMGHRTPLHDLHRAAGAKITDFGGYDMPLHYGSQIEEHHAVRRHAGMFDVSHMAVLDVTGGGARDFLRRLLANDVARLDAVGRAQYSLMLNERGGIVDDLIAYRTADRGGAAAFRLVVNCATREKDLAWMRGQALAWRERPGTPRAPDAGGVDITHRDTLAIVAVQGPRAVELALPVAAAVLGPIPLEVVRALPPFHAHVAGDVLLARTGYTGEDGLEVILPGDRAVDFWQALAAAGVHPAGLAARDTLRLEAGLCLYGQDMDEATHPLESNLGWTIAWNPAERDFTGRAALAAVRAQGSARRLTGLVLDARGIVRHGHEVDVGGGRSGVVTSGIFSPTLGYSIGLVRVPADAGPACTVQLRGRQLPARLVKPPFVRNGQQVFTPA
jgi:aminomethyltransferase